MEWKYLDQYDPEYINQHCPWMATLAETPQDAIFHAEGDVATHTFMVLEELQKDDFFQHFNIQDQEILKAAALFHDIEKRSTTVVEPNGRITSRGHAKKGAQTVRSMLYQSGFTPFHLREMLANLVRYHGLPHWVFDKPNPLKALLSCSLVLDTKLLVCLAKADTNGRICKDQDELREKVAFFQAFCEEQDCWGNAKVFPSSLSRYHFFKQSGEYPDYEPFDDYQTKAVIICGLPGAGKDTHIQKHYKDWPVISLDQLRRKYKIAPGNKKQTGKLVQLAKEDAKNYLRKRIPFVWNATNLTRKVRTQLIDLFQPYKAKVKIDYIEVPFDVLQKQNKNREWVVPLKVIEKMLMSLEIPSLDEAHEVEYFVKDNKA